MTDVVSVNIIKENFPILQDKLVFLDSAASAQKPAVVIDGMKSFYEHNYANVHRGIYDLAEKATVGYEEARAKVAKFFNAEIEEIVFTRGTTDGMNMLIPSIVATLKAGDEIVTTMMEHHSNFVPWQQLAKQHGLVFTVVNVTPDGRLDMDDLQAKITDKTKVVAVAHVSNVLGTINPIKEITALAHAVGAKIVVDGAQAVPHMRVDVKALDVDFYLCSAHKMYGPDGVGVLYGRKELLEKLPPSKWGGEMVKEVKVAETTWNDVPYKFEPGTPPITQAYGLGLAVDFITQIGFANIQAHEQQLLRYALDALKKVEGLTIIGPQTSENRLGAISFVVDNIHPHDLAQVLDQQGIAVRAGHHCAQPLHCALGIDATTRASIGIYNTTKDIDALVLGIKKAQETFT